MLAITGFDRPRSQTYQRKVVVPPNIKGHQWSGVDGFPVDENSNKNNPKNKRNNDIWSFPTLAGISSYTVLC